MVFGQNGVIGGPVIPTVGRTEQDPATIHRHLLEVLTVWGTPQSFCLVVGETVGVDQNILE